MIKIPELRFRTNISKNKQGGSYKIYVPTKEVEHLKLNGEPVDVLIKPSGDTKRYVVGRLDNKDVTVDLKPNDVLVPIRTKMVDSLIREHNYHLTRDVYFDILDYD